MEIDVYFVENKKRIYNHKPCSSPKGILFFICIWALGVRKRDRTRPAKSTDNEGYKDLKKLLFFLLLPSIPLFIFILSSPIP